ncbi:MAG: lycopene cyclase domain-containing protein [Chloroflexi bacterium]|nr:MAG: lycopene cyclase domain-containing protein [Chloroflexota bacterium]
MIMTAVFDSLLIAVGIVGYDLDKILGIYIGKAPIEDFFYAILAAIIIPALWNRNEKNHDQHA